MKIGSNENRSIGSASCAHRPLALYPGLCSAVHPGPRVETPLTLTDDNLLVNKAQLLATTQINQSIRTEVGQTQVLGVR